MIAVPLSLPRSGTGLLCATIRLEGAQVSKRYHPPQTPCERLLQAESIPEAAKTKLREVAGALDPLKLLEEIRAVQAYLMALADGDQPPSVTPEPPDLAAFIVSPSQVQSYRDQRIDRCLLPPSASDRVAFYAVRPDPEETGSTAW